MTERYDGDSEESRDAFRAYDDNEPIFRRSAWQIWRDACAWQAARATAEQSEWQPIETAPKTGRTLLLGYPNSLGKWRTVRGQWMTQEYIDQNWEDPDEAEAGWYETSVEADDAPSCWPITPTYWQPLPTPPADAAIESQRSGDGS
jgi:hypothetical protein